MSKFQIVLLVVFGAFILVAVLAFSLYRGSSSSEATVVIWGSLPGSDVNTLLNSPELQSETINIRYVEKKAESLEEEFTEALARGAGPDLIILPQDEFFSNKAKLMPIPYSSVSERDFIETFIEAGEIYLSPTGVYGLPILIDPMVLYYNRDSLSSAGMAKPLSFWDEIYALTSNLTKRDAAGNLVKSTIALGEVKNIMNAKDIYALLMLQAGTPITGFQGEALRSFLGYNPSLPVRPVDSATEFYTQFSNPTKTFYSWNRSLPEAQTRFTSGDLAYYLGFASELKTLRNKNPTLNFTAASVPQSRVSGRSITIGRLYSVSVSRGTKNNAAALTAAYTLISSKSANLFSQITLLPPARRDLLTQRPNDSVLSVFYTSALQARNWIDPDKDGSTKVFGDLIESVTSGRSRVFEAVQKADRELEALIKN